jgi:hypothetical protein
MDHLLTGDDAFRHKRCSADVVSICSTKLVDQCDIFLLAANHDSDEPKDLRFSAFLDTWHAFQKSSKLSSLAVIPASAGMTAMQNNAAQLC